MCPTDPNSRQAPAIPPAAEGSTQDPPPVTRQAPDSDTRTTAASIPARLLGVGLVLCLVAVQPALAQATGEAFCTTDIAQTIRNLFTLIQFGGPLIGGVLAIGATAVLPMVRRADMKREVKEIRNQGIVWGVIVAPMGTAIVEFLLTHVVAGGVSCGF